jgi:uncharacterized membrane protein YfcA
MLLPVLVYQFGPKQAVPIMAIAALLSNVAKMMSWWREVDWRAFAAYSIPGVPAAALGARTLLVLPARAVDVALGVFFLAMIPFVAGCRCAPSGSASSVSPSAARRSASSPASSCRPGPSACRRSWRSGWPGARSSRPRQRARSP